MFLNSSEPFSDDHNGILLERLVHTIPLAICLTDMNDRLVYANEQYLKLFDIDLKSEADRASQQLEARQIDTELSGDLAEANHPCRRIKLNNGRVYERHSQRLHNAQSHELMLVTWRDISEEESAREELEHQLSLFRKLADLLPDQVFFKDRNHRYIQVNESFLTRRGLDDPEALKELSDRELLSPDSVEQSEREERRVLDLGESIINDLRQETWRNGERVWSQYTKLPIYSPQGEITGLFGFAQDVTEKKRSEQLIWRQANYDHLTQLPNRRLLADRWHSAWQAYLRDKKGIGLILVDLDGFKLINDSKGHQAGEGVLISVAERLRRCTRGKDTVARLSADEFAILATDIKEDADLQVVIDKVTRQFDDPFIIDREEVFIGASLGIALAPRHGQDIETIMMHADQALHQAKRAGGRCYRLFSEELHETVSKQFTLANDVRYALRNKEFSLNFQPIIDLKRGLPVKVETLIRWHHPTRGWVSPSDFIPVAEQTGQIIQIGDWVFREAVKTLARINRELNCRIRLSVNVSPRQLQEESFDPLEWVEYVKNQGYDPKDLVVEITEGLFLDPHEKVLAALDSFSQQGVKISLDDFGTGYASISFLENFEIDVLKLDQAFVRDSELSKKRRVLSEAIINMAKALDLEIIAEGIETQAQADWIRASGCQYGQGYFFSKPLTVERLEEFLEKAYPA